MSADLEAIASLKPLRRHVVAQQNRALERGDSRTADQFGAEIAALDRAMALLGNRHGLLAEGRIAVYLTADDLTELLALIRDDDGDANEQVLDNLEEAFDALLRALDRNTHAVAC